MRKTAGLFHSWQGLNVGAAKRGAFKPCLLWPPARRRGQDITVAQNHTTTHCALNSDQPGLRARGGAGEPESLRGWTNNDF